MKIKTEACTETLAFAERKTEVQLSENTRGWKGEIAKLEQTLFSKIQIWNKVEETERLWHFVQKNDLLVTQKIVFSLFRLEM